ncbi:MAG: trigger factor, partial [Myxococcales bacterium]|nr:trigger factor [Myxococcales bacterium]
DLVNETFQEAVSQHEKTPLTMPVRESYSFNKGQPFTYVVRFEVPPEIEPKDYEGAPVRRRPAVVDASKVDEMIERKRGELTEVRPIPEDSERTTTRDGDIWTMDLDGTFGSAPVAYKDVRVTIGSSDGEVIPGLAAALAETPLDAVGTVRELSWTPPNQDAVVTVKAGLRDVRETVKPELDDEFARDTGEAETLAELRAKFEEQIREEDARQAEREARTRLVNTLLERNEFEVAPSMINREVSAQVDMYKRQFAQQGLTLAQAGMSEQGLVQQLRPRANFQVRAFLLLDAIGKKHDIAVTDEDVEKELATMAEERGQNVDRLRASMESNNQLVLLRAQLREERILDFLMGTAEITEAPDPEHDHDHDHDHHHHDHDHDHDHDHGHDHHHHSAD